MASQFDQNSWYQFINLATGNGSGLEAAWPVKYPYGTAFGTPFNSKSVFQQQWQIIQSPSDNSGYVLRDASSGPNVFMGSASNDTCHSRGCYQRIQLTPQLDDSTTWYIQPWGDGTSYLYTKANGSSYHLEMEPNGSWLWMSSNVTRKIDVQRWNFERIEPINNSSFSTVSQSMPASATATQASSSSEQTSSSPEGGLSTGGKVGVGVGIGLGGFVILVILTYVLLRRRRRRKAARAYSGPDRKEHAYLTPVEKDSVPIAETRHQVPVELEGTSHAVELDQGQGVHPPRYE